MEITILRSFNEQEFLEMYNLMCVLSRHTILTPDMLQNSIRSAETYVLRDKGHIIGTASFCLFGSPTGRKASIEDVVVLPEYQGKGLGRQLIQHLIERAKQLAPIDLHLTSRPSRQAANALYRKMGFENKETNVYTMKI